MSRKQVILTVGILFLLPAVFIYSNKYVKQLRLEQRCDFTEGTIKDFRSVMKPGGIVIEYEYRINNTTYQGKKRYPLLRADREEMLNQRFPVAYERTDFKNSDLVLTSRDMKKYKYPNPVGYSWVEELF